MDSQQTSDGPTTGRVSLPGLYVGSPADRFVDAMEDADDRDRAVLAARALRHDPGCIEARLVLAEHAGSEQDVFLHLGKAVEAGDAMWTPVAAAMGDELTWWGFAGTRPYMLAIAALGQAHLSAGDTGPARECFERLLAMNPNDNQGIRYLIEEMDGPVAGPGRR